MPLGSGVRMSGQAGVVAVTCLALEAGIARGPGRVGALQSGRRCAPRSSAALGIVRFGIAAASHPISPRATGRGPPGSAVGEDVIATDGAWAQALLEILPRAGARANVAGANNVIASPEEKFQLHDETHAAAVDMESHIAAEVAAARGIPFRRLPGHSRCGAQGAPPAATLGLRRDGTPDVPAVLRSS